jgi:hypothetical protein
MRDARWAASAHACERGEKRLAACWLRGLRRKENGPRRRKIGWAEERKGKGRKGLGFPFSFFKILFKLFFKLCKLHSSNKIMHSNHDAQELINSNIIEMIFKYLRAKFI